jgi:two-component system, chemotaxis family, CheB/CheR fusion protein
LAKKTASSSLQKPAGLPRESRRKKATHTATHTATQAIVLPAVAASDQAHACLRVVGIGASSGGLDAFTELVSHLPDDTGMAFVLIQHLDPNHESHLAELLAKRTKIPVTEVQDPTRAQANHIYVIPPHRNLTISQGMLHTPSRPEKGRNMPVDGFFCALAANFGKHALGVVLSGTASDGTIGLQAIKAAGGVTFAQELRTAKFEGMPRSAIASGAVDFVLPPAAIARQLVAIAHDTKLPIELPEESEVPIDVPGDPELSKILRLVRTSTGVDFAHYKLNTLKRRIKRRMAVRGFEHPQDYIRDLAQNREEARALCENCLITVTTFFREPEHFEDLKKIVFPSLIENRQAENPIRIWVPACASGEEAYSLAICLTEFLEERKLGIPFEIFATDISEGAISKARTAIYKDSAVASISEARLERFFVRSGHGYEIARSIRDVCVFARHNVAQDPPFSKLDLISCCNLLIYLGPALQRKVLAILHYALKPNGYLVIGQSESIAALSESFDPVANTRQIYSLKRPANALLPRLTESRRIADRVELRQRIDSGSAGRDIFREADRLVLAEFGPAGVLIDDDLKVLQFRGRTAPYLELAPGEPTRSLVKLAREGLIAGLGNAIQAARQTRAGATEHGFRIKSDGQLTDVAIQVTPIHSPSTPEKNFFLVLFTDTGAAAPNAMVTSAPPADSVRDSIRDSIRDPVTERVLRELVATKEYLQSFVEDNATIQEQLRAANEEAQASNEELETAQEELESANEELNTLNDELKISIGDHSKVNRDLTNLLETISIPVVMVGRDLRIRRFTRAIEPMLNVMGSDVGRLVTELEPQIELPDLRRLLTDAMEGGSRQPRSVRDAYGRWYSMRILPSVGTDRNTDGAVLMLIDIDAAKRGLDFAEAIVETVREPLVILNQHLQVIQANKSFYETFHAVRQDTEQRLIYDLGNGQWNIPKLRELLENILPAHSTIRDFEVTHEFEHVGQKVMLLNASEIFNPNAQARTILLSIEDVTELRREKEALRATNAELQDFAYALTHDLQEPLRMVVNFTELLGREYLGKLGTEADQFIAYSVEGALRIESLLKALLSFWEVTGREREEPRTVDSAAALAQTMAHLRELIAESGAVVTHGELPTVLTEEVVMPQLFQNLISNAIKYRGSETPKIHVSAEKDSEGWTFAVSDNGIGIDPQDVKRVFGMFKRLHGREIPGTGIGLALCKKVIERQHGRIWVESEAGRGATFKFTIPAHPKRVA